MTDKFVYGDTPALLGGKVVRSKDQITGLDVVALGVPWEGTVTWGTFSGCELGTRTIRHASARYSGFLPEYDVDVFDHLALGDYGDVDIVPGEVQSTFRRVEERVKDIIEKGALPVVLGGDHSVSIPVVKAIGEATGGPIGVVHFDAHLDNKPEFNGDLYARCCPLRRIAEFPSVKTTSIVHVGIRGPRNSAYQAKYARDIGATIFSINDIRRQGIEEVIDQTIEIAGRGTKAIYVTVCSDVLDVTFNPGGPPDANGLTSYELLRALYKLGQVPLAGFDVVEIYPPVDHNNASSHLASWMYLYLLGGLVTSRERR